MNRDLLKYQIELINLFEENRKNKKNKLKEEYIVKYTIERNPTNNLWNVFKNISGNFSSNFKSIYNSQSRKECLNYCKENNIKVSRKAF